MHILQIIAPLLLTLHGLAHAATITHAAEGKNADDRLRIQIDGAITRQDVSAVETVLNRYPKREVAVKISSSGGDVEAALDIGRLLRGRQASIAIIEQCYGSCVLLYSGAVERMNPARPSSMFFEKKRMNGTTGLGLHRFYFAALSADASSQQVTVARNTLRDKIARYLRDMNVSTQLLDAMEAVPPEGMKMLTLKEANALGLSDTDPVYEEQQVAWHAARYKITSAEYRKRSVAAESYCIEQDRKKVCAKGDIDCAFGYIFDCRMKFIQSGGK